jgi:hypothetical protein
MTGKTNEPGIGKPTKPKMKITLTWQHPNETRSWAREKRKQRAKPTHPITNHMSNP